MQRATTRTLAALGSAALVGMTAGAAFAAPTTVASGVQYELIDTWSKDRLNQILTTDFPKFAGVKRDYGQAQHGVKLFRVTYPSVIPEKSNKAIVATGLLAIPDHLDLSRAQALPLLSYQHGTVYGKQEVPSMPENSPEMQLMLAQFGGQGYAVIGADYFGMGNSKEPEGYMVKASHQQSTLDMLRAGRAVLGSWKVSTPELFLSGWSQGGFVTMAFLERLEKEGIPVCAAVTASAPTDVYGLLSGFLLYPRPIDASWVNSVVILSAFSFEQYYNVPGLTTDLFQPAHYELVKKAYLREPVDVSKLPMDLKQLVQPQYFQPHYLAQSPYGKLLSHSSVYRWNFQTPLRNYYGEADEAIPTGIGQMAMRYQQSVGNGNPKVQAISTGATNHRGTYAVAAAAWKPHFDALRSGKGCTP